jgi:hypothetical protein
MKRNSSYSSHFHVVDDAHQLIQQADWEKRILETVNSQTSSSLIVAILKIRYDGMVDVFFLLAQEVKADAIQGVRSEFVISNKDQQQVEYDPSFDVDGLVFSSSHLFAL